MKKMIGLLAIVPFVIFTGCSKNTNEPTQPDQTTTAVDSSGTAASGTYQGTGSGYGGELKLEIVTDGGKITDIKLVSDHESSPVMSRAFPVIKDRILEAQTPVVDSVSGATFSSFAVKAAVADAAKQYGQDFGEITFGTKGPETPRQDLDPVTTQLVIVGGGPAGLSAAIEAKEAGVKDIIVVEKLDILGGNGKFDMNFYDMFNSQAQKDNGVEDSAEAFIDDMKNAGNTPERLQVWADGESQVDAWLRSFGVNLNYNYGGRNHMAEKDAYAGELIQDQVEVKVKDLGIDVRTGTAGLDLIMADGKVTGVKVQHKNDFYDINADAVIIATGGFSSNKDLLAKYAPGFEVLNTSNQMGTTGDFIPVFEKNDFKLEKMDVVRVFPFIISHRRDLTGGGNDFILVNQDGERFVSENTTELPLGTSILAQPDKKAFYIYDQTMYDAAFRLQKHNQLGYHTKADTLEGLAEELGINADNFVKTVDIYNKAVDGEGTDPFREESGARKLDAQGPYYGVQVESAVHMTKGGVSANEKAQILNNEGVPVEGIYAAGEVTWISGSYSAAVVFGRVSGAEAAGYILK